MDNNREGSNSDIVPGSSARGHPAYSLSIMPRMVGSRRPVLSSFVVRRDSKSGRASPTGYRRKVSVRIGKETNIRPPELAAAVLSLFPEGELVATSLRERAGSTEWNNKRRC